KYKFDTVFTKATVVFCNGLIIFIIRCLRLALKIINKSVKSKAVYHAHLKANCSKNQLKFDFFSASLYPDCILVYESKYTSFSGKKAITPSTYLYLSLFKIL